MSKSPINYLTPYAARNSRKIFKTDNTSNLKFFVPRFADRDLKKFQILSVNLNHYPRSVLSEPLLDFIISNHLPDLIFLQEISDFTAIMRLVQNLNRQNDLFSYNVTFDYSQKPGFGFATIYNRCLFTARRQFNFYNDNEVYNFNVSRLPYIREFHIRNERIITVNCHFVAHTSKNWTSKILENFSLLALHLKRNYSDCKIIIGGDFNVAQNHYLFDNYFPYFWRDRKLFSNKTDNVLVTNNLLCSKGLSRMETRTISYNKQVPKRDSDIKKYLTDHKPVLFSMPLNNVFVR